MSNHPIFDATLRAFGGAAYANVQALSPKVAIVVPLVEVELSSDNPADADTWRTAQLTEEQTARAYALLVERHAGEFDTIARRIVEGV
jgi:hypothetical protein